MHVALFDILSLPGRAAYFTTCKRIANGRVPSQSRRIYPDRRQPPKGRSSGGRRPTEIDHAALDLLAQDIHHIIADLADRGPVNSRTNSPLDGFGNT